MKTKKWVALFLCVLLALPLCANAQEADAELEGYVTELIEGGFLMEDKQLGQVLVNVNEQTVKDGLLTQTELAPGQYVLVKYNGRLTRSLPPQAYADKVGVYQLTGSVTGLLATDLFLLQDERMGAVLVYAPEGAPHVTPGMTVTVYYDGVMALSEPGQATARLVLTPQISGVIGDMDATGFTLTDAQGVARRVLVTDDTLLGALVEAQPEERAEESGSDLAAPRAQEADMDGAAPNQQPAAGDENQDMLVEGFETINLQTALADGDEATVYYDGTLTEAEDENEPAQLTALEIVVRKGAVALRNEER